MSTSSHDQGTRDHRMHGRRPGGDVVAAFERVDDARAAADELRRDGFSAQVELHPIGTPLEGDSAEEWTETDIGWLRGATKGGIVGAVVGALGAAVVGAGLALASSTQVGLAFEVSLIVGLFAGAFLGALLGGFRSVWGQSHRDVAVEGRAVVQITTKGGTDADRAYAIVERRAPIRVDEFVEGERVRLDLPGRR